MGDARRQPSPSEFRVLSYHPPFVIGNTSHDLGHLDPVTFATPSTKIDRAITTWCRFTTHTFTEQAPDGHPGPLLLDEGRRPRVFCLSRYALSYQLPAAVRLLADPDRYVWEGGHERSWLHRADVALTNAAGAPVIYQVFFAVKKAGRAAAWDVEMTVESAYAFDPLRQPKVVGRTKIAGLLAATVEGRKLHTQRRA